MKSTKVAIIVFLVITICFSILEYLSAKSESLTWDETGHYYEGIQALTNNNFSISPNSPTFIPQLLALPTVLGLDRFTQNNTYPSNKKIMSRMSNVLLTALTGVAIFGFASELYGTGVALFAVLAYYFEPLVFANAHYITLDTGFTLLFFLSYWIYYKYLQRGDIKNLMLLGFTSGLMISAKATGIVFIIFSLVTYLLLSRELKISHLKVSKILLCTLFIFLGIWFTYRFTWGTLGGYTTDGNRLSNKIETIITQYYPPGKRAVKNILTVSLPLGDFPRILKNALIFNRTSKSSFFLGDMRETQGIYFVFLYLTKTPLPILFAFVLFPFISPNRKKTIFIITPIIGIFLFALVSKMDLRLRYLLPAYPFITIICGVVWFNLIKNKKTRTLGLFLIVWFMFTFSKNFPHQISYINSIGYQINKPFLLTTDSNLDWGQGLIALKNYADSEKISTIHISYYGSDDPNKYGFKGFDKDNICKRNCVIEDVFTAVKNGKTQTAISVTNWQECGWYKEEKYSQDKIKTIIAGSILIFDN